MLKRTLLAVAATTLGACATLPQRSPDAAHGLAFAQQRCAGCHAVERNRLSPNPEAPPFESVVNAAGLTAATLKPWLRDSHNFPAMMNFTIEPQQIDALAAYMLTLQRPDYRPAP
jgi:mono/diheme cytochrome c family protein